MKLRGNRMTIKDYYIKLSNTSFHISLYFLVLAIVWTLVSIYIFDTNVLLSSMIFMIISTIYFSFYKYFDRKSVRIAIYDKENNQDSYSKIMLIERDQDCYYFFSPEGRVLFTIMPGKKQYYINNEQNVEIARIETTSGGTMYFHYKNEIYSGSFMNGTIKLADGKVMVKKTSNIGGLFEKNGYKIAEWKRGFLPLNWTTIFRLNIPVLTFHENTIPAERFCIMLLTVIYTK